MTEANHCHQLLAWLYSLPTHDMGGGLTIVSLPQKWLTVQDVDLIKRALKRLAETEEGE